MIYVGETRRSMKERINKHLRDVKPQAEKPVMRRFKGYRVEDVTFAALQSIGGEEIA